MTAQSSSDADQNQSPEMISVDLDPASWEKVLALLEAGVKHLGAPAFVFGGVLIGELQNQLRANSKP